MNDLELVTVSRNNAVVSSLMVAEHFHKRHNNVLRKIEELINDEAKNSKSTQLKNELSKMFAKSIYKDETGRPLPMYYMNRDGFSLLVMGFTGQAAMEWKLKYIAAFNKMESIISERKTIEWQNTRRTGIIARKNETDVIKQLAEYAKTQGSKHSQMLYMTYSRLANGTVGIKKRDTANIVQLNRLADVERAILAIIRKGMAAGKHYKQIYQDCKSWANGYMEHLAIITSEPVLIE